MMVRAVAAVAFCVTVARAHYCADLSNSSQASGSVAAAYSQFGWTVRLVWSEDGARAAAALFRAALLAAGYPPRRLQLIQTQRWQHLCTLLNDNAAIEYTNETMLAVSVRWAADAPECSPGAARPQLARPVWNAMEEPLLVKARPLARGAAPGAARLHALLPPALAATRNCSRAHTWSFYSLENRETLAACRFTTGTGNDTTLTVYVVEEWINSAAHKELQRRAQAEAVPLQFVNETRSALSARVRSPPASTSTLFLDAGLWTGAPNVRAVQSPPCIANDSTCTDRIDPAESLRVADEWKLRQIAPALFDTFMSYSPVASDLRDILDYEDSKPDGAEEAACRWALKAIKERSDASERFYDWQRRAQYTRTYWLGVIVCTDEKELATLNSSSVLRDLFHNLTTLAALVVEIDIHEINCRDVNSLQHRIIDLIEYRGLSRHIGIVSPAEVVSAAAPTAKQQMLPLVSYGLRPGVNNISSLMDATGRTEHLAAALQHLLVKCSWRRVVVMSEESLVAEDLAAALRAAADLALREAPLPENPSALLETLRNEDARVFIVNTDARGATVILRAAQKLGMTLDAGFVWIVREWAGGAQAADAARELCPLHLSLAWRGGAAPGGGDVRLRDDLNKRWSDRPIPPRAAPLLNAIVASVAIFAKFATEHSDIIDKLRIDPNVLSKFWVIAANLKDVNGVAQQLSFDEYGVTVPPVYVLQWTEEVRPRVLQGAKDRCPVSKPPPDRTRRCLVRRGHGFMSECWDIALSVSLAALLLFLLLAAYAVRALRRALTRRDDRLRAKVALRVIARRERASAALSHHLVPRAHIALERQLGAGSFGHVHAGELREPGRPRLALAAKVLRDDAGPADESDFMREAYVLSTIKHVNVVRFLGVCVEGGPPLLLMELADFGDLLRYLRARRHLALDLAGAAAAAGGEEAEHVSAPALTRLAREAASALAYLAREGLVHRDVRAANCLVDARRSLLLGDFGMARPVGTVDGEYACRRRALFPVLWMAPESLRRGVFSAASDVWGLGVLALEIMTLGVRPYGARSTAAVLRLVAEGGGRPPLPRCAGQQARVLTLSCWRRAPDQRPTAALLAAWLAERPAALSPVRANDIDCADSESDFDELISDSSLLLPSPPPDLLDSTKSSIPLIGL